MIIQYSYLSFQTPQGPKSMRLPARPLCMLETPEYKPPLDDFNELSRFLRLSTVPGYSRSETISEYNGNHNQEVWDSPLKKKNTTHHNMKRDWLSKIILVHNFFFLGFHLTLLSFNIIL